MVPPYAGSSIFCGVIPNHSPPPTGRHHGCETALNILSFDRALGYTGDAMRFTVKTKIIAGLAIITLIGIVAMLLVFRGLKEVESNVNELALVEEPLILAAYEMEINMNGIGLEVEYFGCSGWETDWVASLDEAKAQVRAKHYTAAVIDLCLSGSEGTEGLEVLDELHRQHPETLCILLTAYGSPSATAEARRRGAALILDKPVKLAELRRDLQRLGCTDV